MLLSQGVAPDLLISGQGFVQCDPGEEHAFFSGWMLSYRSECSQCCHWWSFSLFIVEPGEHLPDQVLRLWYCQTRCTFAHDRSRSQANRTPSTTKFHRLQHLIVRFDPHFDLIATAWVAASFNPVHGVEVTFITWIVKVVE